MSGDWKYRFWGTERSLSLVVRECCCRKQMKEEYISLGQKILAEFATAIVFWPLKLFWQALLKKTYSDFSFTVCVKKNICHYCERFSLIFFLLAAAWKPQYLIHANDIANLIKQATWNQKNNRQELYLFIYGIASIANWKIIYNCFWLHSRKYIMSVDLFHNFHYDRIWILNEISCFFFSENIQWQRNRVVQLRGTFKENWAQLSDHFQG